MRLVLIAIIAIIGATATQARDPHCRSVRIDTKNDSYWAGVPGPIYGYQCDGKQGRARKPNARAK